MASNKPKVMIAVPTMGNINTLLVVMITKTMSRNEEFADKVIDLQAEIIEIQKKSTGVSLSDIEVEGDGGTW